MCANRAESKARSLVFGPDKIQLIQTVQYFTQLTWVIGDLTRYI